MDQFQHILSALTEGNYQITLHARQRMALRNVTHEDIRSCGRTGVAVAQSDGKIQVWGYDGDGEDLTLICVQENGVLIITVF